ncbi:MAG: FHA domain-containing protein [Candidatus Brocadiae bacterium]|nr:FHA domain-containing protein [Candidatus Brocadiia bacterium]
MIRLTIFEDGWEKSREFLEDVVSVGRSSTCVLPVKESSISRLHCEIVVMQGKPMLVNHAKTNGTLVNGLPVGEAFLKPGDIVMVGRVKLRFDGATEGATPVPVAESADERRSSGLRRKTLHRRRRAD